MSASTNSLQYLFRGKRREEAPSDVKPRPGFTLPFAELVIKVVPRFQNVKTNLLLGGVLTTHRVSTTL